MIARPGRVTALLPGEHELSLPGHLLHWRGFVYLPGHPAGEASLAACDWSDEAGVVRAAAALRGAFVVSVADRASGRHWFFADASGTHDAFVAPGLASTSFLALCDELGVRSGDLEPEAVAERMELNGVIGRRTLVPAIERTRPGYVHEVGSGRAVLAHPGPYAPAAEPGTPLERHLDQLATALRGLRVSCDLTGGADSRLLAAVLGRPGLGLDVECTITGAPGYMDIDIAREVATALGLPLHESGHDVGDTLEGLDDLFEASDGIGDLLNLHRLRDNQHARRARGVDVAVGGQGGELYKDTRWLQDFPRYRSRHSNVERYFDTRHRPLAMPEGMLAGPFARAAAGNRDRSLAVMRAGVMPINTQTYDRLHYEMRMQTSVARSITMMSRYLPIHAPLLDPEPLRWANALPRRARLFTRVHRRIVTDVAPAAARLRTTEGGVSLSAEPRRAAADAVPYTTDKVRRLVAKVRQVKQGKGLPIPNPDHPALFAAARRTPAFPAAVERLLDAGVLATADFPDRYVGRVLTLGMLFERLDSR